MKGGFIQVSRCVKLISLSNPTEYLPMDETFSPIYHRLNQVIKYRAIHPEGLVPPPSDIIIGPMRPPYDLLETMKPYLEGLKNSANVKKGETISIQPE